MQKTKLKDGQSVGFADPNLNSLAEMLLPKKMFGVLASTNVTVVDDIDIIISQEQQLAERKRTLELEENMLHLARLMIAAKTGLVFSDE